MKALYKRTIGVISVVCLISACLSGFSLTRRLWQTVADEPQELVSKSLTADRVLHLAVRYEDGRIEHLVADLEGAPEWSSTTAHSFGALEGTLPPSSVQADIDYHCARDIRGNTDHTVWVDGPGSKSVVTLPEPVDWASVAPYLAIPATLFTLVVDLLTAPIWILWVILTAGGHGECWLPWCN